MELKKVEEYVRQALQENKLTRESDFVLYGAVLKRMGINIALPLAELFGNSKKYRLPAMESVSRARRKIQETEQDLIDWNTAAYRADKQEDYLDYARN